MVSVNEITKVETNYNLTIKISQSFKVVLRVKIRVFPHGKTTSVSIIPLALKPLPSQT